MDDGVLLCCNPAMSTAVSEPASPAFSPLYQQIKALMVRELQAGTWRPGEAIPSETDLAGRFKVSQGTVRKAIDELATENLLVRRQGKGTFVATHAEQTTQYRFLRLQPDDGQADGTQRRFIDCRRLRAPEPAVRVLACCGAALPAAFAAYGLTQVILGRNNGVMFFLVSLAVLWAALRQAERDAAQAAA